MASLSERLRAEDMAKGKAEGIQQGLQKGERAVLIRQLSRRFGPLGAKVQQRLENASQEDLERWTDRVLEAHTLDDVFLDH